MKRLNFHYFPRDLEAGDFIENLLVSAVSSILVIRLYLAWTNYPELGGQNFHIAHMLWGGLIMFLTIMMLLVFLNREAKVIASITGGIGFGAFIDELGKFITRDNNYFYQPTIALIYVIFVLIFLVARIFEKYFRLTEQEYAINALEVSKNAIMHDLDVEEKERALYLLKFTSDKDIIARMLVEALKDVRAVPLQKPNKLHILRTYFRDIYVNTIRRKFFIRFIVTFFVIASIVNFFGSFLSFGRIKTFADWGQLVFSVLSGFFVLIGTQFLMDKGSRRKAYMMYKYAVLVSIFLTQFFRFLEDQLSAIFILILSLIVLSVLQYLIYEENSYRQKKIQFKTG